MKQTVMSDRIVSVYVPLSSLNAKGTKVAFLGKERKTQGCLNV